MKDPCHDSALKSLHAKVGVAQGCARLREPAEGCATRSRGCAPSRRRSGAGRQHSHPPKAARRYTGVPRIAQASAARRGRYATQYISVNHHTGNSAPDDASASSWPESHPPWRVGNRPGAIRNERCPDGVYRRLTGMGERLTGMREHAGQQTAAPRGGSARSTVARRCGPPHAHRDAQSAPSLELLIARQTARPRSSCAVTPSTGQGAYAHARVHPATPSVRRPPRCLASAEPCRATMRHG
jgi:hypothetical protein